MPYVTRVPATATPRFGTSHDQFFYVVHFPTHSVVWDITIGDKEDAELESQQKYIDKLTPDGRPVYVHMGLFNTREQACTFVVSALANMIGSEYATVIEFDEENTCAP